MTLEPIPGAGYPAAQSEQETSALADTLPAAITAPVTPAQRAQILNLIRRAARAEILPRFRSLSAHEIEEKTGPQDLVTEADRAAEAMIARSLQRMFPSALIIGEEAASDTPEIVDGLAEAELAITIDPVDGTWNYATGLATFGVILSMTRYGIPVFGMLYDPLLDDVVWAETNGGAWYQRGRRAPRPLRISADGTLDQLTGFVGLHHLHPAKRLEMASSFPEFSRAMSLRCSCHEFRTLALNGADFLLAAGLTPWDHAAGALIAQEAGAVVRMLNGSDYRAQMREGYLLCAGSETVWQSLRDRWAFLLETPDQLT